MERAIHFLLNKKQVALGVQRRYVAFEQALRYTVLSEFGSETYQADNYDKEVLIKIFSS